MVSRYYLSESGLAAIRVRQAEIRQHFMRLRTARLAQWVRL